MMSEEKIFCTGDYKLAAWLFSKNHPINVQQNPRRPKKAEFVFSASDQLYIDIAEFNSNGLIPVLSYLENLDIMKDRMREVLLWGNKRNGIYVP